MSKIRWPVVRRGLAALRRPAIVVPSATTAGTAHSLAGEAIGTSSVTGDLRRGVFLAGAADGVATVTGAIILDLVLAGSADGVATVTGVLQTTTDHSLAGAADGTSSVTGALIQGHRLLGESTGVATVTGNVTAEWILAGAANGTSSVTGSLLVVEEGASLNSTSMDFARFFFYLYDKRKR